MTSASSLLRTTCCIAGGGPAGMILGYLLARAGIEVVVLEKHPDFLRDFRGDTVHPSTLELMHELGVLEQILMLPHQRIQKVYARIGANEIVMADLERLRTRCKFVALMPQWDFLNFLARQGSRYPTFTLKMQTEVKSLIEKEGRIVGVRTSAGGQSVDIRADLVVAADGRGSLVREKSGLLVEDFGSPIDVLWMRFPKRDGDPGLFVYSNQGKVLVALDRGRYWQCGLSFAKGKLAELRAEGIEALRATIVQNAPFLSDRVEELRDWDDVKLLTVKVDRLKRWYRPGLVCIGDAAHAMSPVGGVGINLAIQDAVAAANVLAAPLRDANLTTSHLAKIQRRREFPTRFTQCVQAAMRKQIGGDPGDSGPRRISWPMRLLERTTLPRRLRTRLISVGIRPEHVKTPDVWQVPPLLTRPFKEIGSTVAVREGERARNSLLEAASPRVEQDATGSAGVDSTFQSIDGRLP